MRSLEKIVADINDELLNVVDMTSLQGMKHDYGLCCSRNMMIVFHIGDSRLYILHENQLKQITKDHSLVQRPWMKAD